MQLLFVIILLQNRQKQTFKVQPKKGIKAVKQGRGLIAEAAAKTARTLSTVTDSDMMEELEKSC